ncbi:MAG TPA: sugar phosphate nucleotidyltransferase [bacterium]|nr:sugar phosphate nucleotidyltransferase [bacterium]HPQ65184.1 sugar phosphate nucleotidyltransferase [bacterium]
MPQAVILAGGMGTRLGAEAAGIPKSLVDVDGAPFILRQLRLLVSRGFRRAVLCVGYRGDMIEDRLGDGAGLGMELIYSREKEDALLGTAGALKKAEKLLENEFLLLYGDSYLDFDYRAFIAAFREMDYDIFLSVFRNAGLYDASNVRLEGERVIYDKTDPDPAMEYIDYGAALFRRRVLNEFVPGAPEDLSRIYARLSREDRIGGYVTDRRFYEIGSLDGLREFREYMRTRGGQEQ